jgi:hypothetical protein
MQLVGDGSFGVVLQSISSGDSCRICLHTHAQKIIPAQAIADLTFTLLRLAVVTNEHGNAIHAPGSASHHEIQDPKNKR